MLLKLEQDNLSEILSENERVAVMFMATWCGSCKLMKPKFKKLAKEHEDFMFIIVDAEEFPESRKVAKITNLPTFITFHEGGLKEQLVTSREEELVEIINNITTVESL